MPQLVRIRLLLHGILRAVQTVTEPRFIPVRDAEARDSGHEQWCQQNQHGSGVRQWDTRSCRQRAQTLHSQQNQQVVLLVGLPKHTCSVRFVTSVRGVLTTHLTIECMV